MATRTFPLLVLPYLAICEVLDQFNLNELIQFSFCSKRSQRIASRKPKGKLEIVLKAHREPEFIIRLNNDEKYKFDISGPLAFLRTRDWKLTRLSGEYVAIKTTGNSTETFWKDNLTGIEKVGAYLTELLKSPITEIHLLPENNQNDIIRVINWLSSRQKSVEKCVFDSWTTPDKYLTHLLAKLDITDEFLSLAFCQDFPCLLSLFGVESPPDNWLTVEHLMSMNCQYVEIKNRNIKSKDLNRFLKHWQNGGSGKLRFLQLKMPFGVISDITGGIEVKRVPDDVLRLFTKSMGATIEIRGGHDIRRNDGTRGTIFLSQLQILHFAVHPDE